MYSGFSGASFANASASRTARCSEASSRRFVSTDATRFPKTLVMRMVTLLVSPAVVTRFIAVRVNRLTPELMFTRVLSAFANPRILSDSCFNSEEESPYRLEVLFCISGCIDHIHIAEQRNRTPVRDRVELFGLALAIIECGAQPIRALAAKKRHRVPEIRSA